MPFKIAVIGDVNGHLSETFIKLNQLHTKNSFAFAIIAGNLFADTTLSEEAWRHEYTKLLDGSIPVSLPTYFSLGTRPLPLPVIEKLESGDGELCPNLICLGRKVALKTSEGFRFVALGGIYSSESLEPGSNYASTYNDSDIEALKGTNDADILVTTQWPTNILHGSKVRYSGSTSTQVPNLGELCTALKPRYFFSISDHFFEREPFFHAGDAPCSQTRFLSLAPYGNLSKQKWIYAFSLEPQAPPPPTIPATATASPFHVTKKRKITSQQDAYNSFRFDEGTNGHEHVNNRHKRQRPRQPPPGPQECYFCLSNPSCETHMIGSIGNDAYLTIAKGPLSTRDTFPTLALPCHMLLIPLHHAPTISAIADEAAQESTSRELKRYQDALREMIVARSQDDNGRSSLGSVTWEIGRRSGVHLQWQFIPVPTDMILRGLVEAGFDVEAENMSYPKFAKSSADLAQAEDGDHFKVTLWTESLEKTMILQIDESFRFDLQFGRKVLCKLLGLQSRLYWRECTQTQAEEEADAASFRAMFKPYDFSLEE